MLVCLACPKQASLSTPTHVDEPYHHETGLAKDGSSATAPLSPSREPVKSFTTQLKDIVLKFSSGAYRHCRPCTAAGLREGSADEDNYELRREEDGKVSVLFGSRSEEHGSLDHCLQDNSVSENADPSFHHEISSASFDLSSSGYDILPEGRNKRRHVRKKKPSSTSSSKSSLFLKQLASRPGWDNAIEELLDEHFRREEKILAEEQACLGRGGGDVEICRADHQLLEEAKLVGSRRDHQNLTGEEPVKYGDDGHVKRSKRAKDVTGMESGEEWVAQVEPGVMITFVALSDGSNHLKRIRFSHELFSKWQAQLWWTENSDMIRELYSVRKSDPPFKPCSSERSSTSRASTTTTCSLHHQHTNTPELQSRVGSYQASPSNTPRISRLLKESKSPLSPTIFTPSTAEVLSSTPSVMEDEAPLRMAMEQHDNPLFDNPEYELCYKEGGKDGIALPNGLWVSTVDNHSREWREDEDALIDNTGCSPCELVHEFKRVKFNN